MLWIIFSLLIILLALRVPVAISLATPAIVYAYFEEIPLTAIIHKMVNGIDSFVLLAIPFFIFAGNLMNYSGITDKIFDFAKSCVGFLRGGLAYVNVGSSIIFAGMSGAAVADAGGLGTIEIKAMKDAKYDEDFAVGVTAASSTIGPIIPPSLVMIIYAVLASVPITELFIAGIIPGFLMALSLCVMIYFIVRKRGYDEDTKFSLEQLIIHFKKSFLSLLTPIIIIGGIISGIFTPTEAAVVTVVYILFIGCVVYKKITWKNFLNASTETMESTAIILFIAASASLFSWILTVSQVNMYISETILSITTDKLYILLFITAITFIIGLFMEPIAALSILVPVFLPIAQNVGLDLTHLGIVMILNLTIGLLTPPVGLVLYVISRVSQIPFERCIKGTLPFLISLISVLFFDHPLSSNR